MPTGSLSRWFLIVEVWWKNATLRYLPCCATVERWIRSTVSLLWMHFADWCTMVWRRHSQSFERPTGWWVHKLIYNRLVCCTLEGKCALTLSTVSDGHDHSNTLGWSLQVYFMSRALRIWRYGCVTRAVHWTLFADLWIEWRFDLERAPWWFEMFERLLWWTKCCLKKTIRRASLTHD